MMSNCQEKNTMSCTGKTVKIESQHTFVCERAERAIFGVFNSFTVKKVSFFTINVKFKVTLSYLQKVGGGMFVQATPPPPKKVGGYLPPTGFTPVLGTKHYSSLYPINLCTSKAKDLKGYGKL